MCSIHNQLGLCQVKHKNYPAYKLGFFEYNVTLDICQYPKFIQNAHKKVYKIKRNLNVIDSVLLTHFRTA